MVRVLIDLVAVTPGDAVLDIATVPGTVARMAAVRTGTSGRVAGIDLSAPMLEVARSKPAEQVERPHASRARHMLSSSPGVTTRVGSSR